MQSINAERRIAALLAGGMRSAAQISKVLIREKFSGVSESSVKRHLRALRGPTPRRRVEAAPSRDAVPPTAQPVAVEAPNPYDAEINAPDDVAAANATIQRLCLEDEALAGYLARGAGLVDALLTSGHDALLTLRQPADLAALAVLVTEEPGCGWEPDEGETAEHFAAEMAGIQAASRARAAALLEGALEIVRGPSS